MRGRQNTCCFTGHRPAKLPWGNNEDDLRCKALKARLRAVVESAILEGTEHFICGMAEGCDLYFCEACKKSGIPIYTDTRVNCGHMLRHVQYAD